MKNKPLLLLLIGGTLAWSITMVKSGWQYSYSLGFWGPNGHDGIWHIALANSLARGSLEMPVFAGEQLKNYHIGFDLLLAALRVVTAIPVSLLYFQILPPIFAFLVGWLTYKFVHEWTGSKFAAWWSTFLVYFGGSWGPIVSLARYGTVGNESMFWAQQSVSTLINPPFALSLVFLLWSVLVLRRYTSKPTLVNLLIATLLFGLVGQVKVYAGILSLCALFITGILQLLKEKKSDVLKLFFSSSALSFLLFFPLNRSSTSLVVFQPFWFLETMMAVSDRVNWPRFFEAVINYKSGQIWWKLIPAYFIAFLVFWFGNLGVRVLGLFGMSKTLKRAETVGLFLTVIAVLGTVLPMLFVQKGTPWNTIQFFYYTIFVMSIFAGCVFARWLAGRSGIIKVVGVVGVLVFTLPTVYATLRNYVPARPPAKLSGEESQALNFLSAQPSGIVLTYPFDQQAADLAVSNPPRPLYLYESTAYVSAYSDKPVFLEDEVNLNITDYDWRTRRKNVEEWLNTLDQKQAYQFLRDNNIKYIYRVKPQRARLGESQLGMSRLFENKEVDIFRVE